MTNNDKKRFLEIINSMAAVYRAELNEVQMKMYWETLKELSIEEVEKACFSLLKTSKFFPVPSEIIELIPSSSNYYHIGADEAWAIALESFDEDITVAITKEIAEARGIALPIWKSGDEIGARMAFRSAYGRLISKDEKPKWFISLGNLRRLREDGITKAISQGRISRDDAAKYLPSPEESKMPDYDERLVNGVILRRIRSK